jgi:hypothetical protein
MRKQLLVFLNYKPTGEIEFFSRGNILYTGKDLLQIIGNDGNKWDNVKLIEYSKPQSYTDDINEFDKEKNKVEKYKVILIDPWSKFKDFMLKFKLGIRNLVLNDDTSIHLNKKESPSKKMKRTAGTAPNMAIFKKLLVEKDRNLRMVVVNLLKYRDIALYPEGYNGKPISGEKAYYIYGRLALKYNGKLGNRPLFSGAFKSTLFNNSEVDPDWDEILLFNYISVRSFFKYGSTKVIHKSQIHREAGLEKTKVYPSFPYD